MSNLEQVQVPIRNWQTGQITGYQSVTKFGPFDPDNAMRRAPLEPIVLTEPTWRDSLPLAAAFLAGLLAGWALTL